MKKFFLLTAILALTSLSSFAYNKGDKFTKDGITYTVTDNVNYVVETYSADASVVVDGTLTVPATVHDPLDDAYIYTVNTVRFYGTGMLPKSVTKVILSDGIKKIQSFHQNTQVKSLVFPASLEEFSALNISGVREFIVDGANPNFKFIYEDQTKDSEAGYLASKDGKTYWYHVYPTTKDFYASTDGVVVIPDDVEKIYSYVYAALPANTGGNTIHLGKSVNEYGQSSSSNQQIVAFTCDEANTTFQAYEGVLYKVAEGSTDNYELHAYPEGKKDPVFTVWDKCKKLKSTSFEDLAYLRVIKLNKVETVANNAFRFNQLRAVLFTDSQKEFTNSQHSWLETFAFEDMVEDITVSGTELAPVVTLTLKDGWDYDQRASHPYFHIVDGMLFSKDETTIVAAPCQRHAGETWTIPSGVTTLHTLAFEYTRIKKFISNAELTTIGELAFQFGTIVEADFSASTDLTNVGGFHSCNKLTKLTMSPGATSISGFGGCDALEEVHVPDGSKLVKIAGNTFNGLKNLKKFVFDGTADYFTTISEKAFYNCTSLKEINFPASTTTIGISAFNGCTSLEDVEFVVDASGKSALTTIKANAFANSGIKNISLPEGVTTIEREAFLHCDVLETITIPSTVTSISAEAFKYCRSLEEINVDKNNTKYSSVDGYLLTKNKETLVLFPAGKANDKFTLLPPSITKIGDYSFYCCENLKNVTIPNKVTVIGDRAFGLCKALNTITFLCDAMIDPAKIDQRLNHNAFDDGSLAMIDVNVRKDLLETYQAETTFYNQFKSISPSFKINDKNEYIAVSDNAVDLLDIQENDWTYVVPTEITAGGKTMSVALIGDYACQNSPSNINEIVIFDNVEYIGANAFKQTNGTQTIQNIFFVQKNLTKQMLSTTRFELTPEDLGPTGKVYKEFADNANVYVRKSIYSNLIENEWKAYKDQIAYKIPGIKIGTTFGTFSREFDVDLLDEVDGEYANYDADNKRPYIAAFTGYVRTENPYDNYTYIVMRSINQTEEKAETTCGDGDGTYIPKNTGVLLRAYTKDAKTPADFYYRIGENEDEFSAPAENVMQEVTRNGRHIEAKEGDYTNYVISGGKYKPLGEAGVDMPIHKSYLHLKEVEGSKGIKVIFGGEEDATAIEEINAAINSQADGKYLENGRIVIVKGGAKYNAMGQKM